MFSRFVKSVLLLGAASVPVSAQAQESGEDNSASNASTVIIVTGRGLADTPATPAYSEQTIARERLNQSASGRIESALSDVAGFQQFRRSDSRSSNPSAQGVTLRALGGNATSRALVLLDGVPMADPFFGYIPLSSLAPDRLASVRVTRGGGAGAFGSGAVAGTIELESAGPDQLGFASGALLVNDRGATEASASIAPQLGEGFAVVSGRWDRGPGFYTTPFGQRAPISAKSRYDSWSAGIRAVTPVTSDIELQVRALVFDDQRTLRFDGADSSASGQDASLRIVGRGAWQFDALAYLQARNFSNIVVSSTRFVPVLDQRKTPANGVGGKLEVRPPVGSDHVLRIGTDYRGASGDLLEEAFSAFTGNLRERRRAGGDSSNLGLFMEDDWTIGRVVLTAGVRADRWTIRNGYYQARDAAGNIVTDNRFADRSGWDTSVRGGLLFKASEEMNLRAAAYTGTRIPTLNELYRPFVVFPVVTQANAALENEKLVGFEAGIDIAPSPTARFSLTAFQNRVENAVANVTLSPNLRQRRNLDAVKSRGVELATQFSFGSFKANGSLAWTDAEVEGSGASLALNGNRPPQTPKIAASGTVSYQPGDGWLVSATLRHVGAQFEDDQETFVLAPATTLDAFAQIPLGGGFSAILRGENLFDEEIITRNQAGSMDLGVPRTLWAGIRFGGR